ncbi:MAG: aspartate kinase, partial [Bacteroidota bacterium]
MKFGGASVSTPDNVRNVAEITREMFEQGPIVVVVSAMGKMTNA